MGQYNNMAKNIFIILSIYLISGCSFAASIERVEDKNLVHLLNNFEIGNEYKVNNFHLRTLSVRTHGECDGDQLSCPKQQVYLAISTIDEAPDQAVYKLPLSHGWIITELKEIDSYGEYQRFIQLNLTKKIPSNDVKSNKWNEEKYKIQFNPWESHFIKIDDE